MKLIDTIYDLLLEASPKAIYDKYYSKIDFDEFVRIISLDSRSKINPDVEDDKKVLRIGKYSKILLKLFKEGKLKPEDYPKAKEYLDLVYKHQVSVDQNKIKDLSDLFNIVQKYYTQDTDKTVFELIPTLSKDDYELLFSGENWIIYKPKSEKGAAVLGHNTQWCTSWGPYSTNKSYTDRKNHFSHHNDRGELYVVVRRNDPQTKFQFHFETKQFMSKTDTQINTSEFFSSYREVTKFFFPSVFDDTPVDNYELDRMDFLPDSDIAVLVNKQIGQTDNELVKTLIDEDGDEMVNILDTKFVSDDNIVDIEYDYKTGKLIFKVAELGSDTEITKTALDGYKSESDPYSNTSEYLRSDISDSGDDDWMKETLTPILTKFYEQELPLYVETAEEFVKLMFDIHFDGIVEDFADEYAYLNEDAVRSANQAEENKITKYIDIDDDHKQFDITITPSRLALFISREKITKITDSMSLFDAYCDSKDLNYDYENPMWEIVLEYPTLKEMKTHLEGYSEKVGEEFEQTPDCMKKRKELSKILDKYFQNFGYPGRSYFFKNDSVEVSSDGKYDCKKDGVSTTVVIKKSNERFSGHISLEKLVDYITIEPLLEKN
jgi:hypothetical protein